MAPKKASCHLEQKDLRQISEQNVLAQEAESSFQKRSRRQNLAEIRGELKNDDYVSNVTEQIKLPPTKGGDPDDQRNGTPPQIFCRRHLRRGHEHTAENAHSTDEKHRYIIQVSPQEDC